MYKISTSPHINSDQTTQSIMLNMIIAMLPAVLVSLLMFGLNAFIVLLTAVASCVAFEYFFSRRLGLGNTTHDLSAVITGILLALNLPSTMPVWMVIVGSFMAIVVAKMAFGGIGKNIFNPALVGRVFLFISFPVQMTTWAKPRLFEFFYIDAGTSATPLSVLKHLENSNELFEQFGSYMNMFIGHTGGSLGETSALAIFIGFVWLLYKKVISWHIPVIFVGSFAVCIILTEAVTGAAKFDVLAHILSGGLMLGAVFMATDYTTSPMTLHGKIIFAIGCGVLTYIIRVFGSYPEGVSFAILIMNAFVPLIDKYVPHHVYGLGKK